LDEISPHLQLVASIIAAYRLAQIHPSHLLRDNLANNVHAHPFMRPYTAHVTRAGWREKPLGGASEVWGETEVKKQTIKKLKNKPAGMRTFATAICSLAAMSVMAVPAAHAAKSEGCTGGGFVIFGLLNGITVPSGSAATIPASNIGPSFQILGKYVEFNVVASTFGIESSLCTGAASPEDISDGKRTVVFRSKTPDL